MLPSSLHHSPSSDRIAEAAFLLATALVRMQGRKSSNKAAALGESSLHILPDPSGCYSPEEYGEIAE
jgi:hypothetical protein